MIDNTIIEELEDMKQEVTEEHADTLDNVISVLRSVDTLSQEYMVACKDIHMRKGE